MYQLRTFYLELGTGFAPPPYAVTERMEDFHASGRFPAMSFEADYVTAHAAATATSGTTAPAVEAAEDQPAAASVARRGAFTALENGANRRHNSADGKARRRTQMKKSAKQKKKKKCRAPNGAAPAVPAPHAGAWRR